MALLRACAQPFLLSLLVATALPASAQTSGSEGAAGGPPEVPTREYAEPGAAEDTGDGQPVPVADPQPGDPVQPAGPPSAPVREYAEEAGFGAPTEAPSGTAATVAGAEPAPDAPVSPDPAVAAVAPGQMEADPAAPPDPAAQGQSDPAGPGADPSAVVGALVEALPEEPPAEEAGTAAAGGEAVSPAMPDEALDATAAELAAEVPETVSEDAAAMLAGEADTGEGDGIADDTSGEAAAALDMPPEEALPETPAEEPLPEAATAPEQEQETLASADVTQPAAPEEPETTAAATEGGAAAGGPGRIVYAVFDNARLETRLFRVGATQGETPEDVSTALDALGAAPDDWVAISPDGEWLLLATQRFDDACAGWSCLAVVPADLSSGQAVRTAADVVHPEGLAAVASGGGTIVFPSSGGPHELDLWTITRQGELWSDPLLLTAGSPYPYNDVPALSADGGRVVFDCGDQPYGQEGTAICEAATDGSMFRVVLTPQDAPDGVAPGGAHHDPDYAPDGSIVFQSRWSEGLWRVADGAAPTAVGAFTSDTAPCVLPDGRIASLWTGREGSGGLSELKVMAPDGSSYVMLLTGSQLEQFDCGG